MHWSGWHLVHVVSTWFVLCPSTRPVWCPRGSSHDTEECKGKPYQSTIHQLHRKQPQTHRRPSNKLAVAIGNEAATAVVWGKEWEEKSQSHSNLSNLPYNVYLMNSRAENQIPNRQKNINLNSLSGRLHLISFWNGWLSISLNMIGSRISQGHYFVDRLSLSFSFWDGAADGAERVLHVSPS